VTLQELQIELREIDKSIVLHTKDGWFIKALASLGAFATLLFTFSKAKSKEWKRSFLEDYFTTIANHIFIPKELVEYKILPVLWHESRHVKHSRWLGLGIHPLLGFPIYLLLYAFLPLPVGGALFRALFELDAEAYAWNRMIESNRLISDSNIRESNLTLIRSLILDRAKGFATAVSGPMYFFSMPKFIVVWLYEKRARRVIG